MLVRSPTTVPGYWDGPGRVRPLPDGFFHSGDLVREEGEHELRLMGRKKDLIIRGGSNISPAEVEAVLHDLPGVREAAVVGVADPELGQRVGVVLVLDDVGDADPVLSVIAGAKEKLADYKVPELVAVTDQLPRNALTKIDREAIMRIIADQTERRSAS